MAAPPPTAPLRIGVLGSGNVGGYLGIALSAGGARVCMVYRPGRVETESASRVVNRRGRELLRAHDAVLTDDPRCLAEVDLCLVCVKSQDTSTAASALAAGGRPPWVLSLQNGLEGLRVLREHLGSRALGGLVTFNVFRDAGGIRRQANRGAVLVEDRPEARPVLVRFGAALGAAGESVTRRHDIEEAQAGKLLLNLTNGVCAATGASVAELLADRDARWCLSRCLDEGQRVLRSAGLVPARVGPVSARVFSSVLRLPGPVLVLAASAMGAATRSTRPSTLQDLDRGRPTEIAAINGAIVATAERVAQSAPANRAVTRIVQAHEQAALAGEAVEFVSPRELRRRIERDV